MRANARLTPLDRDIAAFVELDPMSPQPTRRTWTVMARLVFGWRRPGARAWTARLIWGDARARLALAPAGALGLG